MARTDLDQLREWRRDLHRIPETGFDVEETLAYVRSEICRIRDASGLGEGTLRLEEPSPSALVAFLDAGASHTVAVRAELDALPVTEETGAEYASTHPGRMHACGHDAHMAMALGLLGRLSECVAADGGGGLPRNVAFVFEPAEETTGGAVSILKSGVLGRLAVDRIVGLHMWPGIPAGRLAGRAGAELASSNEVTVRFSGRAAHIASAGQGADALEAAARFVRRLYDALDAEFGDDRLAPGAPDASRVLLKFGHMTAGEVRNQIAASAVVEGSLRTFSASAHELACRLISATADSCAAASDCTAEVAYSSGYPVLANDAALFEAADEALPIERLAEPLLISDDFAWYAQELPAVFLLLGTGRDAPLHASAFDLDESALPAGVNALETLVTLA